MIRTLLPALAFALAMLTGAASAQQMTFTPTIATLQPGNSLAGPTQLAIAEAQKKKESNDPTAGLAERSIADTVKAAFVSRLTSDLYSNVFCNGQPGCQNSGLFDLGDGNQISFIRAGGNVTITFQNPDGTQTVIVVPDL